MTVFAKQLKQLRQEKAFSQEGLAQELFISRQAISKWELGQTKPDIEKLKDIAKFYNKSYEYLLNDEVDKQEIKNDTITTFNQLFLLYDYNIISRKYQLKNKQPNLKPGCFS